MQDPATLSNRKLLQLVGEKDSALAIKDSALAIKDSALASHTKTIAKQDDIIKQLKSRLEDAEKEFLKLWEERFAARSERYIEDPDQLRKADLQPRHPDRRVKLNVFDFTVSRHRDGPDAFFEDYSDTGHRFPVDTKFPHDPPLRPAFRVKT